VIREKQNTSSNLRNGGRVGFHQSLVTGPLSPLSIWAVQLEELDGRGFPELDAKLAGDLAQGVIEVREVIDGHVANEGAANFVVAGAAMQPAKKEEQLKARGKANDDPVGIHGRMGAEAIFWAELACNFYERGNELLCVGVGEGQLPQAEACATGPRHACCAGFGAAETENSKICGENCELSFKAKRQSAGAETEAESAGRRIARAGVEQLRGDAEGASKQP
jgi:hypothetical protein